MLHNNLIIAWRNLMRHRLHTVINLAGLGLGMAFCLLAWRFASQEWSFDRFHSKADRIYRVYYESMASEQGGQVRYADVIDLAFAPELEALSPHIERTIRLKATRHNKRYVHTTFEGSSRDEEFLLADPEFFEVFDFPLLRGDAATALAERNSVVLSYEMAQRLFGDADPLGQRLTITSMRGRNKAEDFTITGVAAPVPRTSSIQFNMLLPFDNTEFLMRKSPDEWDSSCDAFVLLTPEADPADVAPALAQITQIWLQHRESEIPEALAEGASAFHLQPLIDMHSDTGLLPVYGHGVIKPSDPYISYVLVSMALAVLLMGCINFVNLAIGRASLRAAEVGVRKAVGAGRGQLMRQFLGEAVVLSVVGLGAGCALAALLLPAFNATFSQELSLGLSEPSMLGALAALLLLVSLGAGWYPALLLSRLDALSAIRRSVSMAGIARFSRVLVSVQLAISVGLITCTLIMYHQLEHLMARDLGIDQERIIAVDTEAVDDLKPYHPRLVEAFLRHSRIASVTTLKDNFLSKPYMFELDYRAGTESGRETKVRPYVVDHNFVKTMNLELVSGRDFSLAQGDKKNLALISESAAARLGLADPVGEMIKLGYMSRSEMVWRRKGDEDRVVGVVKDFTFESGYEDATPGLLLLNSHLGQNYYKGNLFFEYEADLMLVRVKPGDMQEVVQYMQETWSGIVDYADFNFSFLQQDLEAAYRDELHWRQLITWAAVGAVFISVLGAFALTALAAGRRTKEIGIRKALGASVFGLTTLMTREFACLALIGSLVAWPLSWWWMRDWLNGFAFRIDLAAWHFAAGAAIALVAVLISSGHQAYKAAKADPVEALRYE
ncbi:MAG: ABC transporter permease [Gemmatimonadetes bacterium]|nr:ABC transporter permease [Gemmatimonadota bacterium]